MDSPSASISASSGALVSGPQVNRFRIAQNGSISAIGSTTWIADLWIDP